MTEYKVKNVKVLFNNDNATADDAADFVAYVEQHKNEKDAVIDTITVTLNNNGEADIDVEYVQDKKKIDRIRRITGYLTGNVNERWNDAKIAEERERVKHI